MAAGLGFKNFASGEVLTAADVNAYLNSQTVMVFADAAARTAAITSPQEGMFSYLKDTNATQYYTGSAWTNLDTTGMVNPMTTTGDTIYSSSGTTPARLGIGTTGQVLTVAGGIPSWATPSSGTPTAKGVSIYSTGAQSLSNNTFTALTATLELYDTDGYHSTSVNTSRITIPAGLGGYYLVQGQCNWDLNATGGRVVSIYKNGSVVSPGGVIEGSSTQYSASTISTTIALSAGDYIELFGRQSSGGSLGAYIDSASGFFSAILIGA
jgi:hypothetical protein